MKNQKSTRQQKYEKSQDAILKIILNGFKEGELSRRLGYKFNQVKRWKDHSKVLRWEEFCDLCDVVDVPIDSILESVFGISIKSKKDRNQTFLKLLISYGLTNRQIQSDLRKSRPTVFRMKNQRVRMSFNDVLTLMDLQKNRLEQFLNHIIELKITGRQPRSSPFSVPWLGVVSSALAQKEHLSLPEYSREWVAQRVGLSVSQVDSAVECMLQNELIKWNGKHFEPTQPRALVVNRKRTESEFLSYLEYWTERSLHQVKKKLLRQNKEKQMKAIFRTFMISPETAEKIDEMISEFEERLHDVIVRSTGDKTEIRCFVINHFEV